MSTRTLTNGRRPRQMNTRASRQTRAPRHSASVDWSRRYCLRRHVLWTQWTTQATLGSASNGVTRARMDASCAQPKRETSRMAFGAWSEVAIGGSRVSREGSSRANDVLLESLAYHRERDEESNRVSTPPPSERMRWACFWLVDFLTPNVLSQTVEHLRLSPLDRGDGSREPLSSWISEARTSPLFGGQVKLPICARPGAGWLGGIACEDIPEDIDTVSMSVYSLTAGLQVVLAQFYLTTSGQLALREVLAKPRSTEAVERGDSMVGFVEPFHQKRDDFRLVRQAVHSGARPNAALAAGMTRPTPPGGGSAPP